VARLLAPAVLIAGSGLVLHVAQAQPPGIKRTVKPPVVLQAGDVLFIPARTVHAVRNVGSETGSELATYLVEKRRPLLVKVE
jgi:quercetin dioxygenase-like cupin family protein